MSRKVAATAALVLLLLPAVARALPLVGPLDVALRASPGSPKVNTTVTFSGDAVDGDGIVRTARICFGDGTCVTEVRSPSSAEMTMACVFGDTWQSQWTHRYSQVRTYAATLTVTSRGCPGFGDETKSMTLNVTVIP